MLLPQLQCSTFDFYTYLHRGFHSKSFNIPFPLSFLFHPSLPLSHNRACGLIHLLCNSLIRASGYCFIHYREAIAIYKYIHIYTHLHNDAPSLLNMHIYVLHTRAHVMWERQPAALSFNDRTWQLFDSLSVHVTTARCQRNIFFTLSLASSSSLSAFIRCTHYETYYIALRLQIRTIERNVFSNYE